VGASTPELEEATEEKDILKLEDREIELEKGLCEDMCEDISGEKDTGNGSMISANSAAEQEHQLI
jgi:hypothetical protein